MKKLLSNLLLSVLVLLSACKSTLPTQIIQPKLNGVKISSKFRDVYSLSLDSQDNLYFVDNNVIKKIDSKTKELTTIAGKEIPDELPQDGNIDGDISTAKFGKITKVDYVEKDNSIYFTDAYYIGNSNNNYKDVFIRKITNNKVETTFQFPYIEGTNIVSGGYVYTNINSETYILQKETIGKIDNNKIINKIPISGSYFILDGEQTIYTISIGQDKITKLYIRVNNEWKELVKVYNRNLSFTVGKDNSVYIIESKLEVNLAGEKTSNDDSILLHKIPKSKILEAKDLIDLDKKEYVIGELPKVYGLFPKISDDLSKMYLISGDSIYEINLKEK